MFTLSIGLFCVTMLTSNTTFAVDVEEPGSWTYILSEQDDNASFDTYLEEGDSDDDPTDWSIIEGTAREGCILERGEKPGRVRAFSSVRSPGQSGISDLLRINAAPEQKEKSAVYQYFDAPVTFGQVFRFSIKVLASTAPFEQQIEFRRTTGTCGPWGEMFKLRWTDDYTIVNLGGYIDADDNEKHAVEYFENLAPMSTNRWYRWGFRLKEVNPNNRKWELQIVKDGATVWQSGVNNRPYVYNMEPHFDHPDQITSVFIGDEQMGAGHGNGILFYDDAIAKVK